MGVQMAWSLLFSLPMEYAACIPATPRVRQLVAQVSVRLARYAGCQPHRILVANGPDAALDLICRNRLRHSDNAVAPDPVKPALDKCVEDTGARLRRVPEPVAWMPALDHLKDWIDERTRLVFLSNPSVPTGQIYPPLEILRLARLHPQALVVCDEAYYEFAGVTCAGLMEEAGNLAVIRSFSEPFGLTGLDVGYLIGADQVVAPLRDQLIPDSLDQDALKATLAALDDLPLYRRRFREVKQAAVLIEKFLHDRGIRSRLTYANFILFQVEDAPAVAGRLRRVGIRVRDRSRCLPGTLSLQLGTLKRATEILDGLKRVL
jgi:histidinol-phosphate aminotransferase